MNKKISFKEILTSHNTILAIYIIVASIVSIQLISLGANQQFNSADNAFYTSYNNYIIFKQSFFHLIGDKDLYIHYPDEYFDLYKYSPSFALFMGLLAYLPDTVGLILWNSLNAVVLFFAVRSLPFAKNTISFILLFIIIELVTSMQNSQSNALMAGLLIGAFGCMHNGKPQWATLLLVIATFIKVYGGIGFCLFLLYPGKLRFVLFALLWTLLLLVLPVCVTSPSVLLQQYASWVNMMAADQAASYGLSVMGWVQKWFGWSDLKEEITVTGIILFLIPFLRINMYKDRIFRLLILAFMLIWVIIFNHKAESATFIIAICGISTWYFAFPATTFRTILLVCAFIMVSLSSTDIFISVRETVTERYALKPFACILIWVYVFIQLLTLKKTTETTLLTNNMRL